MRSLLMLSAEHILVCMDSSNNQKTIQLEATGPLIQSKKLRINCKRLVLSGSRTHLFHAYTKSLEILGGGREAGS